MRRRSLVKALLGSAFVPMIQRAQESEGEMRGLVIEQTDLKRNQGDWDAIAAKAQSFDYTDVFVTTTYTGGCHYDSRVPGLVRWSSSIPENGGTPLPESALRAFQPRRIKVHAVINCLNAQYGVTEQSLALLRDLDMVGLLYHPQTKSRAELVPWGGSTQRYLNYNNPATGDRLADIVAELLQKFPGLDGIHLDYIRSPGWVAEISNFTLARYGAADWRPLLPDFFGGDNAKRARFDDWQRSNMTEVVAKASAAAGDYAFSASVFPSEEAPSDHHQAWNTWGRYFDFIAPMNYTNDNATFERRLTKDRAFVAPTRVVPAIGLYLMDDAQAASARAVAQSYLDYRLSYMQRFLSSPRAPTLIDVR